MKPDPKKDDQKSKANQRPPPTYLPPKLLKIQTLQPMKILMKRRIHQSVETRIINRELAVR